MPCQAPAASGVRLRAGTLSTPSTDISTSRIQTGAPGAMRMARASSCGAPSASQHPQPHLAHLAQSGGQGARTEQPGAARGGAAAASQPAARGGRNAAGRIMAAYYAKSRPPCGVMPQAGRRRAGHTMAAMEKYASPSSCPSVGSVRAARPMVISSAAGSASTAWWCPNWVPARFPTRSSRWNAAQARQTSRVTILINKPVGYVSGQAEKGYTRPWR